MEKKEIMLLRYSLPIWMAIINNNGDPKFSQFCSSTKDNTDVSSYDLPLKNMYKEMLKKCVGMSDHTFYVIITGLFIFFVISYLKIFLF